MDEIWPRRHASPPPDETLEMHNTLALIHRLKRQQRTVLRLQNRGGLSYKEMSDHIGQIYTWVNRHLTDDMRALRRVIERDEEA